MPLPPESPCPPEHFGEVRIRKTGRGSLILLHGAGGNHTIWFPITRRAWPLDLVLVDLPGHGRARHKPPVTDVNALMDGLARKVAHCPPPRVVVGHSLGGALALALTDRVELAGVGMVASALRFPSRPSPASPHVACRRLFHDPRLRARCQTHFSRFLDPRVTRKDLELASQLDLRPLAPRIQHPLLFLWARHDSLLPFSLALEARSLFPARWLDSQEIPGGHMVILENPQDVARVMEAFLRRIPEVRE